MFPQSFFFYLCKNYSFLRNGIIIKFRTRKILCTNETKTIVQRIVPRKLNRTRVDRSRRISIRKYRRKYTIRKWWIAVWKSANRADSIYSLAGYPTFWTWFKSSMAHEEDREGRDQSKFHRDLLFCENNGQLCSLSRNAFIIIITNRSNYENSKYKIYYPYY